MELRNFNTHDFAYGSLSLGGIVWANLTETDTMSFQLDNISLFAKMGNDTIATRFIWDDISEDDHNKALIESAFHPHENGGTFSISTADLIINDTLWRINPNNYIDLDQGRVEISNINFTHNRQSLLLDGYVHMGVEDTLAVRFQSFDISLFDFLTNHYNFDIGNRALYYL